MKKSLLILYLTSFIFSISIAQKMITAEDAVNIALKNNFDILVARNDADITRVNNTLGNAGALPSVAINGSDNMAINNQHQELASGTVTNASNVRTNNLNAALALNWTLFDGGRMLVTKRKLNEIEALGEIQFRDRVLQTTYSVIVAYFNVVKQKQQLLSIEKVISFNEERVKILQTSFGAGLIPKNNLLQAKIDFNVYTENAIAQRGIIINAKRTLNQILCQSVDSTAYDVLDSIPLTYQPNKAELEQKLYAGNTTVLALQKQMEISKFSVKEYTSMLMPKLDLNAGYAFSQTSNSAGNISLNRTLGPQVGGSVSIPLYQSGNVRRQISVAKIQQKSAEYALENSKIQASAQLQNALTDFENQQSLLAIEQENALLSKENLEISLQRLRLGQTNSLEVRQAQQSFEDSLTRLINFRYNLKLAETKLKQLLAML